MIQRSGSTKYFLPRRTKNQTDPPLSLANRELRTLRRYYPHPMIFARPPAFSGFPGRLAQWPPLMGCRRLPASQPLARYPLGVSFASPQQVSRITAVTSRLARPQPLGYFRPLSLRFFVCASAVWPQLSNLCFSLCASVHRRMPSSRPVRPPSPPSPPALQSGFEQDRLGDILRTGYFPLSRPSALHYRTCALSKLPAPVHGWRSDADV